MRLRLIASCLGALTLASVLVGCGGDTVSLDPVAKAAKVTSKQHGAYFSIAGTFSTGGTSGTMSGEGVQDFDSNTGSMKLRMLVAGKTSEMDAVYDGSVIYMSSELISAGLPDGKKWLKLDLKRSSEALGIDASSFDATNPTQTLEYLRAAGDVTSVGHEQVRGVETTHYRATIDLTKLDGGKRLAKLYGVESLPTDVWIDAQDRLRRTKSAYSYLAPGRTTRISQSFTLDMYRYDATTPVEVPSDSDAFDATDLAVDEFQKGADQGK